MNGDEPAEGNAIELFAQHFQNDENQDCAANAAAEEQIQGGITRCCEDGSEEERCHKNL
jgi:hypothetical protein